MSRQAVGKVVRQALEDEPYRTALIERPYDALEGYDLEPEEQGALIAGDELGLAAMGVDRDTARRYVELFHISRGGGG
jgi:hypothetical protein